MKAYLIENGAFSKPLMRELLNQAKKLFKQDSNLVRAEGNVVIIGDIHGQFFDMMKMFHEMDS
jgi:hypothetical protein